MHGTYVRTYIHTYIKIADTLESFSHVLFTRHRDGVLKFVCTDSAMQLDEH